MLSPDQIIMLYQKDYTSFLNSLESMEDLPNTLDVSAREIITFPMLYVQWKMRKIKF